MIIYIEDNKIEINIYDIVMFQPVSGGVTLNIITSVDEMNNCMNKFWILRLWSIGEQREIHLRIDNHTKILDNDLIDVPERSTSNIGIIGENTVSSIKHASGYMSLYTHVKFNKCDINSVNIR